MKLIWKILIPVVIVIGVPVAAIYGCFYDGENLDITYNENFDSQNFMNDALVKSLNDSKTTGKMDVKITQDDLNNLLHSALTEEAGIPTDYLNPIYVKISGNEYVFTVGVKVPAFQTRIRLYTTLSIEKNDSNEDVYVFTVTNAQIGRIGGFSSLALNIVSQNVSNDTIESSLTDSGLHMKVDLANGKITYNEKDLLSDLESLASSATEGNETSSLLLDCLDDFMSNDYMVADTTDAISLNLDLSKFANNSLRDTSKEQSLDLDGCISKVKTLSSSSIIDSDHYQSVYQYLISGYDNAEDTTKSYLDGKDFSSVGISDVTAYEGIVNKNTRDLKDIIGDQVASVADLMINHNLTSLSESQMNQYIAGKGFIGYSYLLVDSTKQTLNYITIDNLYCNLYKENGVGRIALNAGISFNGYETNLAFDLKQDDDLTHDYQMGFDVEHVYLGEHELNAKLSDFIFSTLSDKLAGDSTLSVDATNKTVVVSFDASIDDTMKAAVSLIGTPKMIIEGDGIRDNAGRIVAKVS